MEKYSKDICVKMLEIYKSIIQRIVDTGETEESDILFINLYKTEFDKTKSKTN